MSAPTFASLPDGDGRSTAFGFESAGDGYVHLKWLVSAEAARLIAKAEALAAAFETVSELLEAQLRGDGDEAVPERLRGLSDGDVFERLQEARQATA